MQGDGEACPRLVLPEMVEHRRAYELPVERDDPMERLVIVGQPAAQFLDFVRGARPALRQLLAEEAPDVGLEREPRDGRAVARLSRA